MCNVYFVLVASSLFYFYLCAYTYTIRPMQQKELGYTSPEEYKLVFELFKDRYLHFDKLNIADNDM